MTSSINGFVSRLPRRRQRARRLCFQPGMLFLAAIPASCNLFTNLAMSLWI
jgi:hypothetical protein